MGKAALGTDKPASIDDAARNRQAIWDGKQAERADVLAEQCGQASKKRHVWQAELEQTRDEDSGFAYRKMR